MEQLQRVTISKSIADDNEYVIQDRNQINTGRFTILELDKENRKCNLRLKFYRTDEVDLLRDTLKILLKTIFNDSRINKVNVFADDKIGIAAFLEMGFVLEGILSDNLFIQGEYVNEIIMGIDRVNYKTSEYINLVHLKSRDIKLRILTPGDAKEMLAYYNRNSDNLKSFEPRRNQSFYTLRVQQNILSESYRQFLNGTGMDFGIFKENNLIGKIKISNIVYGIFKNAIIGYSMDKYEQKNGYMTEAVRLVLEYSMKELNLHRIEASALTENEGSKKVLLKNGFKVLGVNENYLFIDGKWRNHVTFYKILDK